MEELPEKKPLLKEKKIKIRQHVWSSPKGLLETPQTRGRRYSGQMKLKWNLLAIKDNAMSGAEPNTSHHAENTTPTVKHGVVAASCCGDVFHRQGLGNWSELKERWMALNTERFLRQMGG